MTLEKLFKQLDDVESESAAKANIVRMAIQVELTRAWDDCKAIQDAMAKLESFEGVEYMGMHDGIYAWVRCYELSDVPEREREFFEEYLSGRGFTGDFENDCISSYLGDDNYQIQDDTQRDNGVWQGNKIVIEESEYCARLMNEDLDDCDRLDESDDDLRRNALIEAHMQKSGYFPGTFRVDTHGNVEAVDTRSPEDKAKVAAEVKP